MPGLRRLAAVDALVGAVPADQEFCVISEDWSQRLRWREKVAGSAIKEELARLVMEFGKSFSLRAFNDQFELSWDGEAGVIVDMAADGDWSDTGEEEQPVETDVQRHPGLSVFPRYDGKQTLAVFRVLRSADGREHRKLQRVGPGRLAERRR